MTPYEIQMTKALAKEYSPGAIIEGVSEIALLRRAQGLLPDLVKAIEFIEGELHEAGSRSTENSIHRVEDEAQRAAVTPGMINFRYRGK